MTTAPSAGTLDRPHRAPFDLILAEQSMIEGFILASAESVFSGLK
jgi:PIN domain nuclease of toxin-antitoxin system